MNWKTLYTSKRLGAESRYETEKADLILNTYFLDYERLNSCTLPKNAK